MYNTDLPSAISIALSVVVVLLLHRRLLLLLLLYRILVPELPLLITSIISFDDRVIPNIYPCRRLLKQH